MILTLKADGWVLTMLRHPLWTTHSRPRAQKPYWTWRLESYRQRDVYVLTLLGILHTLIGLKVRTR